MSLTDSPRTTGRIGFSAEESQRLGQAICDRIRLGEHLSHVCASEGMPSQSVFYKWLDASPSLKQAYAYAREGQAQFWANQIVEISDTCKTSDEINAARLRVDARKWVASRLLPRIYGDKIQAELGRPGEFEAIDSARLLADQIAARLGSPKPLEAQAVDSTED